MRQWYQIRAAAKSDEREILIYDEIGTSFWNDKAVTAEQFMKDLQALPSSVRTLIVRINSPGGDPFAATAIANALRDQRVRLQRNVRVCIDGLAASAATVISCAGQPIEMEENALFMVHLPYTIEIGTAEDMRKTAEALDKVRDSIVSSYRWVSTKSERELVDMMTKVTWMSAHEAKANGFVTTVVSNGSAVAKASVRNELLASWKNVPNQQLQRVAVAVSGAPLNVREIYEEMNRPRTDAHQESGRRASQAAARPRTIGDIARDYYESQPSESDPSIISTSQRGGSSL
jgi:ATP-dependent protease ClpP protease subunit